MITIAISANTSWYIYNFRRNTILKLFALGYKVLIIAPKDSYSIKLIDLGCDFISVDIQQRGKNPLKDLLTLWGFYKIYKKSKPAFVLNFTPKNNIYSTLAASYLKINVINNIAGLGSVFINDSMTNKIARKLYKISQPRANKIFFQNKDDKEFFLCKGIVNENIIDLLPGSGVDLERFSFSPAPNDQVVRFILVARMLFDKGISYYARAAHKLKDIYGAEVEFYLLGFIDGKHSGAIGKEQISSWVDTGYINYLGISDKVEEEIGRADCVVLPSFYREGVPRSLLEAAAMGKPIVTTNNVGCKETVEDGVNGFLCEPRSAESLIHAMDRIIKLSHEQRLAMGHKSRELVERKFDEKFVIEKYINAIKDVTA
ncbi:glycosyltransferase family 4 protein [Symbiopectobacterium sp. RP]|uniref:glycosyltransferase family 4 protein n=1 Tax=Symbiopectobacterium sp. RP TaxID=3248553 RepID=UPI003D2B4989